MPGKAALMLAPRGATGGTVAGVKEKSCLERLDSSRQEQIPDVDFLLA